MGLPRSSSIQVMDQSGSCGANDMGYFGCLLSFWFSISFLLVLFNTLPCVCMCHLRKLERESEHNGHLEEARSAASLHLSESSDKIDELKQEVLGKRPTRRYLGSLFVAYRLFVGSSEGQE